MLIPVVDLWEAHHRHTYATRNQGNCRLFGNSGKRAGPGRGHVLFGREAPGRSERGAGGDHQRAAGACEHAAESLDGAPVHLTISREL